jgi:acyl carrier protein
MNAPTEGLRLSDQDTDAIFEQVRNVLSDVLSVSPETISMESRFAEDLELDSYNQILLVMALEDDLGIEIPDDAAAELVTVQHAVEMVGRIRAT